MKKITAILLSIIISAASIVIPTTVFAEESQMVNIWDGSTATSYAGGSGTSEDPYLISNIKKVQKRRYIIARTKTRRVRFLMV